LNVYPQSDLFNAEKLCMSVRLLPSVILPVSRCGTVRYDREQLFVTSHQSDQFAGASSRLRCMPEAERE
jgi:hypothetical protein